MLQRYYKEYSHQLQREMEFKVYGHAGRPIIVFPAQSGRFYDMENFLMVDIAKWYLEAGLIQLFCVDSVDDESFSAYTCETNRIEVYEKYVGYICEELVPKVLEIHHETSGSDYHRQVVVSGCSLGAYHALNFFLRRPDLFSGVFAQSGVYQAEVFFPQYQDARIYDNSPLDCLGNMPSNHPFIKLYQSRQILVSVGTGDHEQESLEDTCALQQQFQRLGLTQARFEFSENECHDWVCWRPQFAKFLQYFCD